MSFENYPKQEETTVVSPQKKNPVMPILLGLLIAALLGTWGYIIYDKNQTKTTLADKDNVIATTTTQKEELQKELEDAALRYDLLKSANNQKDSTISAKDMEIAEKQRKIQELISKSNASQSELAEARRMIASLNGDLEDYRNQIEILQGQKMQLTQERNTVTIQRDKVQRDYDSANVVIKEKENLIDIGSTLQASNFGITPINEKSGGKEKETSNAKRVDKLRVSFDIVQNLIAQSGNKEIYVLISGPDGRPIAMMDSGTSLFTTRDGQERTFTKKLDVNYTQSQKQNISFDWKNPNGFATGAYKIEVFNNGFKIGEGITTLKKGGLFS